MRLYVGGCFQGKLEYVLSGRGWIPEGRPGGGEEEAVILDGETYSLEEPEKADILNHFHLLVKRLVMAEMDVHAYVEKILAANPRITIICDEVGMGLVPIDALERRYREAVGRCCCLLAQSAECVERIVCGRGMKIK